MVVIKVVVLLVVIASVVVLSQPRRARDRTGRRSSRPTPARSASSAGAASSRAPAVIFFAYIGFDAVSTAAQEARNPQRDMPIGILGSLGDLHRALHRAVALVLTGMVKYTGSTSPRPSSSRSQAPARRPAALRRRDRRARRPQLGHPRHAARPAAHLLLHGPGRPAAARLRQGPPALPHAVRHHDPHRRLAPSSPACCRSSLLGELVSIGTLLAFAIVCSASSCCAPAARPAPPFPHAAGAAGAHPRRRHLPVGMMAALPPTPGCGW